MGIVGTNWQESIGTSSAWTEADAVGSVITRLEGATPGAPFLARATKLAEVAKSRLEAADPDLVFPSILANLGAALADLRMKLESREEGQPDPVPDDVVDSACHSVAEHIHGLPTGVPTKREAAASVKSLQGEIAALLADAQAQVAAGVAHASAVREEIEGRHAEVAASATSLGEKIAAVEAQAGATLAAQQAGFDAAEAARVAAFEAAETARVAGHTSAAAAQEERLGAQLADSTSAVQDLVAQTAEKLNRHRTEQEGRSDAIVQRLEELETEAETLVESIGRTGLTGGFVEWEKAEGDAADKWRRAAQWYGAATAAVLFLLIGLKLWLDSDGRGVELPLTVSFVLLAAVPAGLATYARSESSRHRRNQVIARRTEIELKSFGPFIAKLDPTMQGDLTAAFTPVYFGKATAHAEHTDSESAPADAVMDRLTQVLKSRATRNAGEAEPEV